MGYPAWECSFHNVAIIQNAPQPRARIVGELVSRRALITSLGHSKVFRKPVPFFGELNIELCSLATLHGQDSHKFGQH